MSDPQTKKPRRLNIAALLNILLAIFAFGVLYFLAGDPDTQEEIHMDSLVMWTSVILSFLLLISSIAVLFSIQNSHFFMLGAAILFYGAIIYQNASLLQSANIVFNENSHTKLLANITRKSLTLALTIWATMSTSSRAYFAARLSRSRPSSLFKINEISGRDKTVDK